MAARGSTGDSMIDQIGNYRVVRKLGAGGMGEVYEGVHEQIGRRAAIKLLHKEVSQNPDLLARFYNEARASNLISHPSIVDVYELGQLPDGRAYIIMQFLDGESLGDRLLRLGGRLSRDEAVRLGRQIASAMAAAHAKGIIHRDLKPDNVMVVRDPEAVGGERVKIVDFGIAKVLAPLAEPAGQRQTRAGTVLGTPAYMSPEQCGGAKGVTEKTDVYALGAMLYEFLIGRPMFSAEGTGEMMAKQIYEQPAPLWEIDPSLPAELVALVHSMLAKAPEARPSMTEVASRLSRLGAPPTDEHSVVPGGEQAAVRRTQALAPPAVGVSRTRRRLAVVSALFVVAAVAGGAFRVGHPRPDDGRQRGQSPLQTPHKAVDASADAVETIRWSLITVPPGAEVLRTSDRETLGFTPWRYSRLPGRGTLTVLLHLEGYIDQSVALPLERDESRQLTLVEQAPAAAPPSSPPLPMQPPEAIKHKRARAPRDPGKTSANVTDADIAVVK